MNNPIFKGPSAKEIQMAARNLRGKAYGMFILMLAVLREPTCVKRTKCLRSKPVNQEEEVKRIRGAFLICWKQLTNFERATVKYYFMKFLHDVAETGSSLGAIWRDESQPEIRFDVLCEWCREVSQSTAPWSLFAAIVNLDTNMASMAFRDMWLKLSEDTRDSLLATWYDILSCACHAFAPKLANDRTPVFEFQLTANSQVGTI